MPDPTPVPPDSNPDVEATGPATAAATGSAPAPATPLKGTPAAATPTPAVFPDLNRSANGASPGGIDLLRDVSLQVRIELGRTKMLVEDVLRLGADSVVELDKSAGDPIDIYVNGRHIARGEVLVLNENFCVRVSEIIEPLEDEEMPEAGAGPTATLRMSMPKGEVA
ncbi:MAG: flagellar motor switch protein FliN [Phycisphaerales bacterium]